MSKSEIDVLKARATQMGLKFHTNIGLAKLKAMVNTNLAPEVVESTTDIEKETKTQRVVRLRKAAHKLIRIRVACMHPDKKDWEGETFTAGNSIIGSTKKYVPFNNDEGWHVPQIILNMMAERKCQVFTWVKGPHGNKIKKGKQIKEFAIEILPPLSGDEIADLAERQAVSRSID